METSGICCHEGTLEEADRGSASSGVVNQAGTCWDLHCFLWSTTEEIARHVRRDAPGDIIKTRATGAAKEAIAQRTAQLQVSVPFYFLQLFLIHPLVCSTRSLMSPSKVGHDCHPREKLYVCYVIVSSVFVGAMWSLYPVA